MILLTAWARLDLDFDTDELLVEEIQSDLIRDIYTMNQYARRELKCGNTIFQYCGGADMNTANFIEFSDGFLQAFRKHWHEAILAATVSFAFDEIGVSKLYYHSFETGNKLKNIEWSKPPRSLYTELPRKFCFDTTSEAPIFLQREKKVRRKLKKMENSCWFHMAA